MSPIRMSRIEAGIRKVLEFNKAFNQHDVESILKLLSDDCKIEHYHPAPDGTMYFDRKAITQFLKDYFNNFLDVNMEIEEIFGFGDRCIMRWKCKWTNKDGKKEHIRGVDIFKIKENLICEQLSYVKG